MIAAGLVLAAMAIGALWPRARRPRGYYAFKVGIVTHAQYLQQRGCWPEMVPSDPDAADRVLS